MAEGFSTEGMLDIYLYENDQLLEKLQETVLEQKDADGFDEDSINEIFRTMHTIKGSSGVMMYDNITKVSHKLEDIFYFLRESKPQNVPHMELVEYVLSVSDFITAEMDKIREGGQPDGDPKELITKLEKFLDKIKNKVEKEGQKLPPDNTHETPKQFYIAPVASESSHFYQVIVTYRSDTEMCNIRAYTAVYALKDIAEDLLYYPDDIVSNEESAKVILEEGFRMLLQTKEEVDAVKKLIDGLGVKCIDVNECTAEEFVAGFTFGAADKTTIDLESSVEDIEAKNTINTEKPKEEIKPGDFVITAKEPGKPKQLAKGKAAAKQAFISVNVEKMDMLMDLIGELVISEAVVLQNSDLKVPGLELNNFKKAAGQLTKISTDLQDVIMSMRMMPLTNTFQKMNRIVFDVSRKLGKDIELQIEGDTTEVDKNIIEHISDPLMHLIRNSLDHGIEMPEEREKAGKEAKGHILLSAKNEGGKVFISVKDDGKGLDRDKILTKAKEHNLLENIDESKLTDKEIYQFITYPGFSTKDKVSEYSGRGVGMDVVIRNLQEIGGTLDIESTPGKGSEMVLKIPLTLAIINGIVMDSGNSTFVIETGIIQEFIRVTEDMFIHEPGGREFAMIRGECFPVIRLGKWYNLGDSKNDVRDGAILIVEVDSKKICLFVDKLRGEQEIVVKPIPPYIKKINGISGCTQLGDGSIALILDPAGMII